MPFSTITAGFGGLQSWSFEGPFQNGTSLYVPLNDLVAGTTRMFKSADSGVTWAEVDPANAPFQGTIFGPSAGFCSDGSGIVFAVNYNVPGTRYQISKFNMNTDLWGSTTVTTNDTAFAAVSPIPTVCTFRPSDGKLIIAGSPESQKSGGFYRPAFFTFDPIGLTFTGWNLFTSAGGGGDSWGINGIVQGVNRLHCIFIRFTGAQNQPYSFYQQVLTNANTFGTLQLIDSGLPAAFDTFNCYSSSDGTKIALLTQANVGVNTVIVREGVSADPIVFTSKPVGIAAVTITGGAVAVVAGSVVLALNVNGGGSVSVATDQGGGFGAFTNLGATPNAGTVVQIAPLSSAVGVLIQGTVYFALFPVGPPGPSLAGVTVPISMDNGGAAAMVALLPAGLGTLCRFSRPLRCKTSGKRLIQVSKDMIKFG